MVGVCGFGSLNSFFSPDWVEEVLATFNELVNDAHSAYRQNFPPMNSILDEETGELVLEFALAGYSAEDLEVTVSGDTLHLKSKKAHSTAEGANKKVIKQGIRAREFAVKYTLPAGKFDTKNAKVSLKNGLLRIVFPAATEYKPIVLPIE